MHDSLPSCLPFCRRSAPVLRCSRSSCARALLLNLTMSPIQTSALLILFINAGVAFSACTTKNVDFIVLDGDATLKSIEDNIRADLAPVGLNVAGSFLAKAEFNKAMQAGDSHLCFSDTWDPPYDPHSCANSWFTNNEAYHMALKGLPAPITYDVLKGKANAVQSSPNVTDREAKRKEILSTLHSSATELPSDGAGEYKKTVY